jgi:hypothetical protein
VPLMQIRPGNPGKSHWVFFSLDPWNFIAL